MKKLNYLLAAAALVCAAPAINAATITLVNGELTGGIAGMAANGSPYMASDYYGTASGTTFRPADGWNCFNANGSQQLGSGVNYYYNDNSMNSAGMQGGGGNWISQTLAGVGANEYSDYTITLDYGFRSINIPAMEIELSLYSKSLGTTLASTVFDIPNTGTANTFTTGTFNLSITNTSSYASTDDVELRIKNTSTSAGNVWNSTAIFRNVSVEATPVPEPSTYALIGGVAALGVALVARRRKAK